MSDCIAAVEPAMDDSGMSISADRDALQLEAEAESAGALRAMVDTGFRLSMLAKKVGER
jgi:tRNA threonylcarbamoyladenosine modification (KEOPS) complex  Pcc1 subunit